MRAKTVVGCAGILVLMVGAGTANAAGPRDVIAEAEVICAGDIADSDLQATCDLRFETNGEQILDAVCVQAFDGIDNGFVDYFLRNCDRSEGALLRKVSSAVLSLDDFLARGKVNQKETAARYLCDYANKFSLLQGAGKVANDPAAPFGQDLAADAQDIALALGFSCE